MPIATPGPIRTGDVVYLSTRDAHQAIRCDVVLASANGRSLALEFTAVVQLPSGSAYIGTMAVLQLDDGRWVELLGSHEVMIERAT